MANPDAVNCLPRTNRARKRRKRGSKKLKHKTTKVSLPSAPMAGEKRFEADYGAAPTENSAQLSGDGLPGTRRPNHRRKQGPRRLTHRTTIQDEITCLPFASIGAKKLQKIVRPPPARDLTSINYVTVAVFMSLRFQNADKKSPRPQDLSSFLNLHVDILFEILSHMHPLSLVYMSRANKQLRRLIRSDMPESIWRDAFQAQSELPVCPSQISGRRWCKLLFGRNICEGCGKSGTAPDYRIWCRLCTSCMWDRLETQDPFPHEVEELVPKTRKHQAPYDSISSGFSEVDFWRPEAAAEIVKLYERRKSEGTAALANFVESQTAWVEEIYKRAEECDRWAEKILSDRHREYNERRAQLLKRVCAWVVAEGCDDAPSMTGGSKIKSTKNCPTACIISQPRVGGRSPTVPLFVQCDTTGWRKIRPDILLRFRYHQEGLRRMRIHKLRQGRRRVVAAVALRILSTPVPGSNYAYYPPPHVHAMDKLPCFVPLILEDSDIEIPSGDSRLSAALGEAPGHIDMWCMQTREELSQYLPNTPNPPNSARLDLATSVFGCYHIYQTNVAIGWDELRGQMSWVDEYDEGDPHAYVWRPGCEAARALVLLLEMDPETTTPADMDAVDARFLCGHCSHLVGRDALKWWECIVHMWKITKENPESYTPPRWALLSPFAAADIRRREGLILSAQDDYSSIQSWACNLCDAHLPSNLKSRTDVLKHICDEHVFM